MVIIKCNKCGCEMSAMSEACPVCGTPTASETSIDNQEVSKTDNIIIKSEIDSFSRVKSLEEALILAMNYVKTSPDTYIYISPWEDGEFSEFFDECGGLIVGNFMVCNKPGVFFNHDGLKTTIENLNDEDDCREFARDIYILCNSQGYNLSNHSFCFTFMSVIDSEGNLQNGLEIQVELYLKELPEDCISELQAFNSQAAGTGDSTLAYDNKSMTVMGRVTLSPFMERLFSRKSNDRNLRMQTLESLRNLIQKLSQYC